MPLLVVIQGAPATGKSTIARHIREELHLPTLTKDDIKELLYDTLEQSDEVFSILEGRVATAMLFTFAETFLKNGRDVVIESAFYSEFARDDIRALLKKTDARFLELFCYVDEEIRIARFENRAHDGTRHTSHTLRSTRFGSAGEIYPKLALGESIEIDTATPLTDEQWREIMTEIEQRIVKKEGKDEATS